MENVINHNNDSLTSTEERIRKEVTVGKLEVTNVYESTFQKEGMLTAEVKQTIKTIAFYPKKSVSNEMQDSIYSPEELGIKEEPFESVETRVSFLPVRNDATIETVTAQLAKFPDAVNYKVMGSKPILTSDQLRAIEAQLTTVEIIADRQVMRYPKNADRAGQLILDANGKPQYRHIFFSKTAKLDIDMRVKDLKNAKPEDYYTTPQIEAELQNAPAQTVL